MSTEVIISERRIDWVTGFSRTGDRAARLAEVGQDILSREIGAGDKCTSFGFEGFYGQRTKHAFVGERHDGVLVRLGSETASDYIANVLPLFDHVSRIDYAVTVYDESASISPADDIWRKAVDEDEDAALMPTVTRTQKRWGGYTTYIGDRSSAVMARVYDKHMESKGEYHNGSWRFELELKRHASEQEFARLNGNPEREERAPDLIATQFSAWGLLVPWRVGSPTELWHTPPRQRDIERSRRWLKDQVGKSARWVASHDGVDGVLKLLALDEDSMNGGQT